MVTSFLLHWLTGVEILFNTKLLKVEYSEQESRFAAPWGLYTVTAEINGEVRQFQAEALLNATGRAPNVHDVGLETVRLVDG